MPSVTRRPRSPAGERAGSAGQLLTALERLLRQGESFTELSVRRLIEEAGVSRATFYAHFRDKGQLIIQLADQVREKSLELAQQWDPSAGEDGAERYARFFVEVIALHRANLHVLAAVRELAGYDPAVRDFYTADLEAFDEAVRQTLIDQKAAGATDSDVDAPAASRVIVWGGGAAIARHIEVDDGSGDEIFARELGSIWWYGAYRRPPRQL